MDKMSRDEEIGFHKGSLTTLSKERNELLKMASIVEQLMQMHIKALSGLGVNIIEQDKSEKRSEEKKKPIEDLL